MCVCLCLGLRIIGIYADNKQGTAYTGVNNAKLLIGFLGKFLTVVDLYENGQIRKHILVLLGFCSIKVVSDVPLLLTRKSWPFDFANICLV